MTDIATGAFKSVRIKKEATPGVFAGASGAQELIRNSFDMNINIARIAPNTIRSDQQRSASRGGAVTGAGTYTVDLIPGAAKIPLESAMRRDFTAGESYTATTIAAVAATGFTDSASQFLVENFKVGDIVASAGFSGANSGNNSVVRYIVTSVVAPARTAFSTIS